MTAKIITHQTEANSTALFSQFELSNYEGVEEDEASTKDSTADLDTQEATTLGEDERIKVIEDCQLNLIGKFLWTTSTSTA